MEFAWDPVQGFYHVRSIRSQSSKRDRDYSLIRKRIKLRIKIEGKNRSSWDNFRREPDGSPFLFATRYWKDNSRSASNEYEEGI